MDLNINDLKATKYYRRAYEIDAIRLTTDNMQKIADYIGGTVHFNRGVAESLVYQGDVGHVGEWIVNAQDGGAFLFYSNEDFKSHFWTHDQRMSSDEKYARVFQLLSKALRKQDTATYHGDQTGMDLVAIETTKKILGEL